VFRGHEFAWNLLYELLYLPVAFHPAIWLVRRWLEQTRELACDELVAERLMDARVYAESIMSIGETMIQPKTELTLGVF
jgi:beta-lactamase regulating signal transducer with metallopeptidase domain